MVNHNYFIFSFNLLKDQPKIKFSKGGDPAPPSSRLPCYDFTPVTNSTLGAPLQKVRVTTSGITSSHGVTGGVYKARERIHRCMADQRLLAIPTSCRRVTAYNPNLE